MSMSQGSPSDGGDGGGFRRNGGGGGNGMHRNNNNKKRRRQRPQRPKRPGGGGGGGGGMSSKDSLSSLDSINRERIFQHIEGLLRQIREAAEEGADYTEEQLSEYTQLVTSFTRDLEEEGELPSDRVRAEYMRVRDKLNHALKG